MSHFLFTESIPCKSDSSLFYVEYWGPVSVYVASQTRLPSSAESLCCVHVSQTQPSSSAESLCRVESESDSALLLSPVYLHKFQGRLSKSLLSLWRRLSHPSTESPCCVHIVREFDSVLSAES